jgi:hypothetical protein
MERAQETLHRISDSYTKYKRDRVKEGAVGCGVGWEEDEWRQWRGRDKEAKEREKFSCSTATTNQSLDFHGSLVAPSDISRPLRRLASPSNSAG